MTAVGPPPCATRIRSVGMLSLLGVASIGRSKGKGGREGTAAKALLYPGSTGNAGLPDA